jgi:peptidoglycan/LPS O-acetylase OafA/YrhL
MGTVALRGAVARPSVSDESRILLIDGIRAVAAIAIVWHHFAQYWPISETTQPVLYGLLTHVHDYARVAQVFFVIGGFVMASRMARRRWTKGEVGRFVISRYCRLGLPYLAVIGLAMVASAIARGWLPDDLVGRTPTLPQLMAHTVFLQDILGHESLSAGLWFVCINFQLGLLYALMLWVRDAAARRDGQQQWWENVPLTAGALLSVVSLFYFNLHDRWSVWCVYYFGEFFLGVLAEAALRDETVRKWFSGYVILIAAALAVHWRWRLATSLAIGLLLYVSQMRGVQRAWSASGMISYLGRTSYSLFLVHFPVFLVVAAIWMRMRWDSTPQTLGGLVIAFVASLAAAAVFHRLVEKSAGRLSRTLGSALARSDVNGAASGQTGGISGSAPPRVGASDESARDGLAMA